MPFTIFYKEKATFWGIKTRSSKNRKIDIFPKGIIHGFGPKKAIFPTFFFGTIGKKRPFTIFKNGKTPFEAIKITSSKKRKMAIFPPFFFRQYRPEKCLLRYSPTKKQLSRLLKQELQKVEKLTFFQRG